VFSVVVSCCCEKLVAEARNSLGTQGKGNVHRWKPLPSIGSEGVTVNTSACIIVNCKNVVIQCVKESNKSDNQSKNLSVVTLHTCDSMVSDVRQLEIHNS
jgi:hypothetical protein